MKKFIALTLLTCAVSLSAWADRTVKANDSAISYTGRVLKTDDGKVRYDWVGTYFQTDFTGGKIAIKVSESGESFHNVFIDGKFKSRIQIKGTEPYEIVLADKLSKGTHRLCLQKSTEGEYGSTTIHSITVATNGTLKAVPARKRMIEFIGDSYSCGYGVYGANEKEHFKLSTEDVNKAYDCTIARYFDADYAVIAHSGLGVCRNYRGKDVPTMSKRYGQIFDEADTIAYDFKAYTPDLVTINLGSNDFSIQTSPFNYVDSYVKLVKTIRSKYPNAQILCIYPHSASIFLRAAIDEVGKKLADMKNVYMAQPMGEIIKQGFDLGSDHHPNVHGNQKIAMTLIPQIAAIMGWNMHNDL